MKEILIQQRCLETLNGETVLWLPWKKQTRPRWRTRVWVALSCASDKKFWEKLQS